MAALPGKLALALELGVFVSLIVPAVCFICACWCLGSRVLPCAGTPQSPGGGVYCVCVYCVCSMCVFPCLQCRVSGFTLW